MVDAIVAAPWTSTRPKTGRETKSARDKALLASSHCWTWAHSKWICSLCHCILNDQDIIEAASSACPAADPRSGQAVDVIERAVSGAVVGGKTLHESHRLLYWPRFSLHVCSVCGKTASTDPRQLTGKCTPSKKGHENLARIRQGKHPSHHGPSAPVIEADLSRVRRSEARRGVHPPGVLW